MDRDQAPSPGRRASVGGVSATGASGSAGEPAVVRQLGESESSQPRGSGSQQSQLQLSPDELLAREKERRVHAEQQVEAEKQLCLELDRLLQLERRKVKLSPSGVSTGLINLGTLESGGNRGENISQGSSEEEGALGRSREEEGKRERKEEDEHGKPPESSTDIPSPFSSIAPRQDDVGQLSAQFLFDNFSSTVFSQLPEDLQKMLHVEGSQENECEGRPPSPLTLAFRAIRMDNPRQLKELLMEIGETVLQSPEGAGLLEEACECGSDGCVRVLLDSGCNPEATSRADGMSAIHLAAQNDHASCISLLLKRGTSPNLQDNDGQTALFSALCEGYRECVDTLLEAGSSLQAITKMDYTVLHAAVSGNLPDILRRLLVHILTTHDHNIASHIINYRDTDGNTALHLAASRGFKQCAEVLCGCPQTILTVKDRWNRTALDISTNDCRDILMSKDSKEVVVCVQARVPDTQQATPIAIGRTTVLRHYKCVDVELLAARTLEQYCYNLKGHIPESSGFDMESSQSGSDISTARSHRSGENSDEVTFSRYHQQQQQQKQQQQQQQQSETESNTMLGWEEPKPSTWAERLQRDLEREDATTARDARGKRNSGQRGSRCSDDIEFLRTAQQGLARMDLGTSSIASYRVGPLSWSPGELGKQQRGKSLHAMVGDRRGGGLSWISGSKPTEIHITLKGYAEGHLDQLAFELMIPRATLHHYISMAVRDKAIVLHGPQGCGKTYLAKNIAEFIKHKLGATRTHILYVSLHPAFKRDDLFRMLKLNGLLKMTSDNTDTEGQNPNPHIVILDDLDRISGYSTPSILSELLTMLNYRGPLNPTWMDTVYSREGNVLYPAGMYYLKTEAYFIATRTQASGEALPAAVMDRFSHTPLARDGEPCAGILYRQLLARLIHTRHGDLPHRWDKVYRCVCWIWELWQLYNRYMKQLDLAELSLGLKHVLQCPVESGSSDNIQNWLCQLWEHHMAPRIEETVLHSRRMDGQHHQQTAHLLLRAVVEKAFRPTCPLEMEAATSLLESLFPASHSSSFGPSLFSSSQRQRHGSRSSDSFRHPSTPPATAASTITVHSTSSAPVVKHGHMGTPDSGSVGSRASNSPVLARTPLQASGSDTTSLDRVKLRHSTSRAKSTLRRLRSRTVSLFSKDVGWMGGGGGEGEGAEREEGGENRQGASGKFREIGSTLPRLFKKARTRTPLPAVAEKKPPISPGRDTSGTRELEDFFDMLSLASSNRFDDQRSPAPLSLTPKPTQSPSHPVGEELELPLAALLTPLTMSMPDLLCDNRDTQQKSNSIAQLFSEHSPATRQHSEPVESYSYVRSPPKQQEHGVRGTAVEPNSEPLRRRIIHREEFLTGSEDQRYSSAGTSPAVGHPASPLATTTYVYVRENRGRRELSDCRTPTASNKTGSQDKTARDTMPSPTAESGDVVPPQGSYKTEGGTKEEGMSVPDGGTEEERMSVPDSNSPDGAFPEEMMVGDIGLPPRASSDTGIKRHHSARTAPCDPVSYKKPYSYCGGGGVREGWTETLGRRGRPGSPQGRRTSMPVVSVVGNGQSQVRSRVFSEGDRSQSLEDVMEARSTHILFDAGLGFLSPDSPVVKGISMASKGSTFPGGFPKGGTGKLPISVINEHHEM